MADKKISALPPATTPLAGTEVLPIVQSSTTDQVSVANLTVGRTVGMAGANITGLTASSAVATDASKNLVSVTNTGTGSNVLATGPSFSTNILMLAAAPAYFFNSANSSAGKIACAGGGSLSLYGYNTEMFRINENTNNLSFVNLKFNNAAQGVDFSANTPAAGKTSQLLNWYEEGTWTPVVADATSGGNVATVGTAVGRYTRIGRQVFVQVNLDNIDTTGMTAGNQLFVRGLPFTCAAGFNPTGSAVTNRFNFAQSGWVPYMDASTALLQFADSVNTTANATLMKVSDVQANTADIYAEITYTV